MNIWLVMFLAGFLTFLLRLSFIWLLGRIVLPRWLQSALLFVPVAVFSAIIFSEIFFSGGDLNLSPINPRLPAAILASLVAWKTRNVIWVVTVGMGVLWILSAIR